ncbi:hypothetical protein IAT38_002072 [Cryptococcus sp. DSM 104549]
MKAVLIKNGVGHSDALYLGEEATPQPGQGQVQVKIKTFGLNRMDILQREGQYPLPPQASKTILGVEFAGVVSKLGEGASQWKEGDEVYGLAYGGAYAEYIVSPEDMLLPKPKELSWVEAAAIPEAWITATQALLLETSVKEGGSVLIHAGASGVGVAAIQIALHVLKAKHVFTTCGSDDKVAFLKELGDSDRLHVFNYRTQNFAEEVKKVAPGVDLIVDFVGKDYWNQNIDILRLDGTLFILAFLSGAKFPEGASIAPILGKRLTVKGSTLRSRTVEYQHALLKTFEKSVLPGVLDGTIKIKVHEVYPWTDVVRAHKDMESNKNSGKLILEIPDSAASL